MRRTLALALIGLGVLALRPDAARAQYFGQNKVQYGRFDFQIIQTQHFDVYYYGRERAAALDGARMAERAYARLSRILEQQWIERKPLILYASSSDFQQTNATEGDVGEGTGGFTEPFKHRMVVPFTGAYADFEHVLQHEMVHAFQFDVFSHGHPGAGIQTLTQINPPLWFMEGMAEYLSIGPVDPHTAMWLRDAAVEGNLPTIEQLTYDPRIFPYRFGHSIWAYIGQRWGDEAIGAILHGAMAGGIEKSFQRVLGESLEQFSEDWRDAVQTMYLPQLADHQRARHFSRALLTQKTVKGTLHVSPEISPDGREVAYLSERDFFFVDLYLADADSGHVLRRLVRSSINPNFETLRFINSTGAWSPDGASYAFAAKSGGQDNLVILDVPHDRIVAQHRLGVDAITNPAWSPDGRQLVFTGYDGGWSDLYVVDADGQNLRRLTTDRYADLMPAWSPDGRTVAFTTDRGPSTDFDILRFSNMRIALYYLDGDSIRVLPGMDRGKNINPVWSPDGRSLAFVSDRSGIDNVFLYDLGDERLYQLTNAYTGITGITDLSPAISWASQADRMLVTYYENGDYNVYAIDNPRALKKEPYRDPAPGWIALANASALPLRSDVSVALGVHPAPATDAALARLAEAPGAAAAIPAAPAGPPEAGAPPAPHPTAVATSIYRSGGGEFRPSDARSARADSGAAAPLSVAALLDSANLALPDTAAFGLRPYKVRFTPDYISRPTIGYTRDNFGRGVFGGTAIELSDILGNQTLIFSGAVNGRISEAQVLAAYANSGHRWNYDVGFQQQPLFYYGSSSYSQGTGPGGSDVLTQSVQRLILRQVFADTYYPLNRFRRLEFGMHYTNVAVATLNLRTAIDPVSGTVLGFNDSTTSGRSLNLVQPVVALVYDNSLFGYTSPFFGKRYRLEVSPTFGDWRYTQVLGDYRRYDLIKYPFTVATRLLALGRFGRDGDLFPVFLGSTDLVRGYTFGSYDATMCTASRAGIPSATGCPELDQLIGSRIAVFSAEFRFQLVRNLTLGFLPIGFPPIEGALWYDAGIAWNSNSTLRLSRAASTDPNAVRVPLTSYGVGVRVNVFGIAIIRVDYALPQQRPGHGGYWMLSLGPPF
jgi:Tol biopolymer transport system component